MWPTPTHIHSHNPTHIALYSFPRNIYEDEDMEESRQVMAGGGRQAYLPVEREVMDA